MSAAAAYSAEETYTLDDLRRHRPLAIPATGAGALNVVRRLICRWPVLTARPGKRSPGRWDGLEDRGLEHVVRYHLGGDEAYARDMALLLCRLAYDMPLFSLYTTVGFAGRATTSRGSRGAIMPGT